MDKFGLIEAVLVKQQAALEALINPVSTPDLLVDAVREAGAALDALTDGEPDG